MAVWKEECEKIEQVQRIACKGIMKDNYFVYDQALKNINLSERRLTIANCVKSEKFPDLFSKNEKYIPIFGTPKNSNFAKKWRLYKSSIPAMQRLLNQW